MKKQNIRQGGIQIILLAIIILLVRIVYVDLYNHLKETQGITLYSTIYALLRDYLSLGLMLILTIYCTLQIAKHFNYGQYPMKRTLIIFLLITIISIITSVVANRNLFFNNSSVDAQPALVITFLAALLINAIIMIVTDLAQYFYKSQIELKTETDKKHKAQYQYTQLKQQLNPHFLINSLSLLDYLVQSNKNERASAYIKKLANVYRYLLTNETEHFVPLADEIKFIASYTSLLEERFVDSLFIEIDIPEKYNSYMIVPCGLQILVENATKHNVVNKEHPLHIRIYIENEMIVTANNLQPRISQISMGFGLDNLRKQYADISDVKIVIEKTDTQFIVKLPLIEKNIYMD